MIHAAGSGVTLTLIGTEPGKRDPALSEATREAVLVAVVTIDEAGEGAATKDYNFRVARRAVALKAVLLEAGAEFTPGERTLLSEWLDRLTSSAH